MHLSEILKRIEYIKCLNFEDCEIRGVSEHSKSVKAGFVFVCVKGNLYDGNDFIKVAISLGACAVVTSDESAAQNFKNVIIVENPRKCEAEIAKALYGETLDKIKIIGITGTKGKTTTAKILAECSSFIGLKCISIGTLGTEYYERGKQVYLAGCGENTTPNAPYIYKALADAYSDGARVGIIEVSSQALKCYRVWGIPFTVCIFTNFSPDHIGKSEHSTLEEYLSAKRTLFSDYGSKICILNSDDSVASFISHGVEHIIEVGEKSESFRLSLLSSGESYSSFLLNGYELNLSLGGEFNAYNAALAVATASLVFGRDISQFSEVLKGISVPGRYEIYKVDEKKVIIDFAHNADSFRSIMTSARKNTTGKLIALFGSVGERSLSRRRELAEVSEELCDFLVITSDNPGEESVEKICGAIFGAFVDKNKAKIIADREAAIRFAVSYANKGDTVLLLGKGHEEYQLIGKDKIPFSEREIIKSLGAVRVF